MTASGSEQSSTPSGKAWASRKSLWAALAAAFAVRAALLILAGSDPSYSLLPDSADYVRLAENLSRHGAFSLSATAPLAPDITRTPGYPAFLAALCRVSDSCPPLRAVLWLQALLGALSCALVFAAARRLWSSEKAAWAACLGLAFDWVSVAHGATILTETLFQFVFCAGFYVLVWAHEKAPDKRPWGWASAGLTFGCAALARPVGVYYFLVVIPVLAFFCRRKKGAGLALALFACGALFPPVTWTIRNKLSAGEFTFTSIQGLNAALYRGVAVEMELSGSDYPAAVAAVKEKMGDSPPGKWAARFILSHPFAYAKVLAKDCVKLLGGHGLELASWIVLRDPDDDPRRPSRPQGKLSGTRDLLGRHPGFWPALAAYLLFLGAAYALAAFGFRAAWREGLKEHALLAATPIAYFLLVSAGALAYYRLRIPLMPAVFLLAGKGLVYFGAWLKSKPLVYF